MRYNQPHLNACQTYLSTYSGAAYCSTNTGSGVDLYVIDRGVLTSHSDLSGRTETSIDCSSSTTGSAGECVNDTHSSGSGHGTHVAAIAGGTTYGWRSEQCGWRSTYDRGFHYIY